MSEVIDLVTDWRTLVIAIVGLGIIPGLLLRAILLPLPKGHALRRELLAELTAIKTIDRPLWVIGQIETVIQEAPAAWRGAIAGRRVSGQWLLVLWIPVGIVIGRTYGLWAGSVSGMAVGTVAGVVDGIRDRGVIRRRQPVVNAVARPATITTKVQVPKPTVVVEPTSDDTRDE
ncbi:MAG: hypothetical protein HZB15_10515 [Actinobacteria bacterium]|nr:hypothetical protein [Actinomycetota bacterium]